MGNSGGHITSGVKEQAAGSSKDLYKYVNLAGGGILVDLMKKANRTKDYSEVDRVIKVGKSVFIFMKYLLRWWDRILSTPLKFICGLYFGRLTS